MTLLFVHYNKGLFRCFKIRWMVLIRKEDMYSSTSCIWFILYKMLEIHSSTESIPRSIPINSLQVWCHNSIRIP